LSQWIRNLGVPRDTVVGGTEDTTGPGNVGTVSALVEATAEDLYDRLDPRKYNNFLKFCRLNSRNFGSGAFFTMLTCYRYCQKFRMQKTSKMWEVKSRTLTELFMYFYTQRDLMQNNDLTIWGQEYSYYISQIERY
jgi:hypothetical protein